MEPSRLRRAVTIAALAAAVAAGVAIAQDPVPSAGPAASSGGAPSGGAPVLARPTTPVVAVTQAAPVTSSESS